MVVVANTIHANDFTRHVETCYLFKSFLSEDVRLEKAGTYGVKRFEGVTRTIELLAAFDLAPNDKVIKLVQIFIVEANSKTQFTQAALSAGCPDIVRSQGDWKFLVHGAQFTLPIDQHQRNWRLSLRCFLVALEPTVSQAILFDPDLIRRFDVPGPRYTSYPTADRFTPAVDDQAVLAHLGRRGQAKGDPLSLYFHIPFCNTICYYCGCNKIITKDRSLTARYLNYLEREMDLVVSAMGGPQQVSQMHWGGGTPTFLQPEEISRLVKAIKSRFDFRDEGEYSIEIDPRKVSAEVVALLAREGFNRMSVGIQDFDPEVQRAVNRIQTVEETAVVIDAARANGFRSVSVDLIYGLPFQNLERFARTLDIVLAMQPDRLSLYNYAHLPTRFMPQRRINAGDLPSPDDKLRILAMAIEKLSDAGYVFIGMDHFAHPKDELAIAQQKGSLQRNFQGYSTHAECDMLGFGVSSIGKVDGMFIQSERDIEAYYTALDAGRLPVMRGWVMTEDDRIRAHIIQSLMCHFQLSIPEVEAMLAAPFVDTFEQELRELESLAEAGLVELSPTLIQVTERGRMLARIIAMTFDAHLRADREQRRYSRVI